MTKKPDKFKSFIEDEEEFVSPANFKKRLEEPVSDTFFEVGFEPLNASNKLIAYGVDKEADKADFIESITRASGLDTYMNKLSVAKQKKVLDRMRGMKYGLHVAAPILCLGADNCPFINHCPLIERDAAGDLDVEGAVLPRGEQCVLEHYYMRQQTLQYFEFLKVDANNPVERGIANELALIDLLKNRALMIMSGGDREMQGRDLMSWATSTDENGRLTETKSVHPVLNVIHQLEDRRARWLDKLLQTREAKLKSLRIMGQQDTSSQLMTEFARIRDVISQMTNTSTLQIKEAIRQNGLNTNDTGGSSGTDDSDDYEIE